MKLGHTNDEIKYDGTTGTVARYVVILDGEPTFYITCDSADADRVIRVQRFKTSVDVLPTLGRFEMTEVFTEDADGGPLGVEKRVDEKSVYRYVIPRLAVLLGRLLRAA